jgi:hypothetical protein
LSELLPEPCPSCGAMAGVEEVHGHGQCRACGTNIEPCCAGNSADDARTAPHGIDADPHPFVFEQVFEHIGGRGATVTGESLRFALAQRLGTELAAAADLCALGVRLGKLHIAGDDCYALGGTSTR